jgi:hypothetical protein
VCVCGTCLGDYAARRILGRECLNKVDDVEADKSNSEESRRRHRRKVQQKQTGEQEVHQVHGTAWPDWVKSFQFSPPIRGVRVIAPVGMADKAVRVAVRVRPLLPHEAGHSTETLTVEDNHVRLSGKSFGFDHVFGAESNQVRGPVGGHVG